MAECLPHPHPGPCPAGSIKAKSISRSSREKSSRLTISHRCPILNNVSLPSSATTRAQPRRSMDLHPPRSARPAGQDRRQTDGCRSLTEYVTVIPNVSIKLETSAGTDELALSGNVFL